MRQNFRAGASGDRHGIRAVLAHAHPVAVASGGDGDGILGGGYGKRRGAQTQRGAKRSPLIARPADDDGVDAAAIGIGHVPEPASRAAAELDTKGILKRSRRKAHRIRVMRRLFLPGTGHGLQIGKFRPPHRRGILGTAAGTRKIRRFDQLPLVGQHPAGGCGHGGAYLFQSFLRAALRQVVFVPDVALTARAAGAYGAVFMLAAGLPRLPGIGSRYHRLGFQCFLLEGYRHFRQHHSDKVVVHIHLGNRAVLLPDQHGKPHSLLRRGLYGLRRCFRRRLRRSIRLARRNAQHDPRHHQTHDGGGQNILCQCSHWYPLPEIW